MTRAFMLAAMPALLFACAGILGIERGETASSGGSGGDAGGGGGEGGDTCGCPVVEECETASCEESGCVVGVKDLGEPCGDVGDFCDGDGSCARCAVGLIPDDPVSTCPALCTNGCAGGVCQIDCSGDTCRQPITCPPGMDCRVVCGQSPFPCQNLILTCPDKYSCALNCAATNDQGARCDGAEVRCGRSGLCTIGCSGATSGCATADIRCGRNQCQATCGNGSPAPNIVDCDSSCDCTECAPDS